MEIFFCPSEESNKKKKKKSLSFFVEMSGRRSHESSALDGVFWTVLKVCLVFFVFFFLLAPFFNGLFCL